MGCPEGLFQLLDLAGDMLSVLKAVQRLGDLQALLTEELDLLAHGNALCLVALEHLSSGLSLMVDSGAYVQRRQIIVPQCCGHDPVDANDVVRSVGSVLPFLDLFLRMGWH